MSSEQRLHPRVDFVEETIYFSEQRNRHKSERIHYSGTLFNLSKGGAGIRVSHPHQIDEEIWLEGLEGFTKAQPGTVKWVKEHNEEEFEIGVQFF